MFNNHISDMGSFALSARQISWQLGFEMLCFLGCHIVCYQHWYKVEISNNIVTPNQDNIAACNHDSVAVTMTT